ncbi:ribosome biogenesis GTP-binding protein YihA/YsxC [Mycoplasma sp. CSL7475-4]|uniref:ribosome biogenesis GTP-binding protein YihA/YsxC n=1 Tax=Mycoplasma sp. CSL7475-4 TaxID=2973942 RepID=UPI00216AEC54|nr:ribosome biogenesis GTP-binding protein YihA/YsxC [Mycoplasma sp. CSL7475-4]MCS4537133.1 ribosome biogenesis GTP-binding protein YihA/YsxC [Mycoplasma sp. CSL7475-4]
MWKFVKSALEESSWIDTQGNMQVVFWGRSNVGKSSLLNAITNQKISFVSKTPGRTQLINYFADLNNKYIIDLPGYGYAAMGKEKQDKMLKSIAHYLQNEHNPKHIFILLDSRTGITKIDFEIINFISSLGLNFSLVYTKVDKLNQKEKSALIKKHNLQIQNELAHSDFETFLVSSQKKINLDELIEYIDKILYHQA